MHSTISLKNVSKDRLEKPKQQTIYYSQEGNLILLYST